MLRRAPPAILLLSLVACGPDYSPDIYAAGAVQQANKVEQGVVIGVRDVAVSAGGAIGAVSGGAAGGLAGAQVGVGPVSAFTALGGTLVGGITGSAIERASGDTRAFEYIVRKSGSDLVSVTQKDQTPLALGQHVLVIAGSQARVVADYTVPTPAEKTRAATAAVEATSAEAAAGMDVARAASLGSQVNAAADAAIIAPPRASANADAVAAASTGATPTIGRTHVTETRDAAMAATPAPIPPAPDAQLPTDPTR